MIKITKEEALRRYNAAKEQKRKCADRIIARMREEEIQRTGKEPAGFVVW